MANPLRKTMVYLGLADEELEYETPAPGPVAPVPAPQSHSAQTHAAPAATRAPVTPLRKTHIQKNVAPTEMNEILTVHPKQYKDAQVIAENFREGIPVIINLSQMTDADARRLIDFAGGLSQGLYGKIERVTSKVFLLSPSHVSVSGDTSADTRAESSFFVQS
ncbi:cell division protein SepF [Agreia pratensis]|jgi:cell division inhibitor SepF|uniref:Cell division protein SepF n=1 Tax=Agreia pratensis TaxID=150121 RepID=A0A1X7L6Y7_9MICO|nr:MULTISPECIES: cell division protein SepF [Agreia]MBF4634002.1 cell division protein SepF [Agreia pratensis]SMG49337.1 cell division inhibitor SepF [Agreia pratensis]SMQ67457.1 cell division inhibitor SepF [Agreia sp. VKM Ac-1783]